MMNSYGVLIPIFMVLLKTLFVGVGYSQWTSDVSVNTPVSTAPNHQRFHKLASDGHGGVFITWEDIRSDPDPYTPIKVDIYAQHLNASGFPMATLDGVPVSAEQGRHSKPQIVADGLGGAIIAWVDGRSGSGATEIYAQRIDGTGERLWAIDGINISNSNPAGTSRNHAMVSDGANGAIITWWVHRKPLPTDLYAQRIDQSGTLLWGTSTHIATGNFQELGITTDGKHGAIISWVDQRGLLAQHLDAAGTITWNPDGVMISGERYHQIVTDGSDGAIIVWGGEGMKPLQGQRLDNSGTLMWGDVVITDEMQGRGHYSLVNDNAGGVYVAMSRGIKGYNVYVHRIDHDGNLMWNDRLGVPVSNTTPVYQVRPSITLSSNGVIVAWTQAEGIFPQTPTDIYAQCINSNGRVLGPLSGIPISTAVGNQSGSEIVSDNSDGTIIVFADDRSLTGPDISRRIDIYAQKLNKCLGDSTCYRTFCQGLWESDASKRWFKRPRRTYTRTLPSYTPSLWNVVEELMKQQKIIVGTPGIPLTSGTRMRPWLEPTGPKDVMRTYWNRGIIHSKFLARGFDYDARRRSIVNRVASLPATKQNNGLAKELLSLAINLALSSTYPPKTTPGLGNLVYNDGVSQTDDLGESRLRLNGKTIAEIKAIGDRIMTMWSDISEEEFNRMMTVVTYINDAFCSGPVTALDIDPQVFKNPITYPKLPTMPCAITVSEVQYLHETLGITRTGDIETRWDADFSTDIENFTLNQNYPNPFNPTSTISFTLPEQAFVTLKVYNVLGQEVATLVDHELLDDGNQEVEFNAGSLSSGVYFYRLVAETIGDEEDGLTGQRFVDMKKMLLLR